MSTNLTATITIPVIGTNIEIGDDANPTFETLTLVNGSAATTLNGTNYPISTTSGPCTAAMYMTSNTAPASIGTRTLNAFGLYTHDDVERLLVDTDGKIYLIDGTNYLGTAAAGTRLFVDGNIEFKGNTNKINKVIITAPATSATLTLANGSTLATSGAYSTTLTATATTSVTLPTSGTLVSSTTVTSADYAPTMTSVANLDSTPTASGFTYTRNGSYVDVVGLVTFDATTTLTLTKIGVSLPIASNLAAATDLVGMGNYEVQVVVAGDATNDRAEISFTPVTVSSQSMPISFRYKII